MTGSEINELRYRLFKMIIESRVTGDASSLFPYIADDCVWGGAKGKDAVIESLKEINVNYKHDSTIVQLGPMPEPVPFTDEECNRIGVNIQYDAGEICMYDITLHNELLFRLDMSEDGKIKSFYGTFPFFFTFHPIES